MKIFLDSNVWVSAFLTRGLCADLVRLLLRRHERGSIEVVLGAPVREKTVRILVARFHATESDLAVVRTAMDAVQNIPASSTNPPIEISGPEDVPIVACALAVEADLFVTGEKALFDLAKIGEMSIVSPRQMYERLIRSM